MPDCAEFVGFPKMARLSRECIVTEKIDGTNAVVCITEAGDFLAGSRTRWVTTEADNFGFARWAHANRDELLKLGPGRHFGEWWGSGIQRGYGLTKGERRFSLFNVARWGEPGTLPACCSLVPVLYRGEFSTAACEAALADLRTGGSRAAPGFAKPEGIVCFHVAGNVGFKKTLDADGVPKGVAFPDRQ
jgi:hypothetical protein